VESFYSGLRNYPSTSVNTLSTSNITFIGAGHVLEIGALVATDKIGEETHGHVRPVVTFYHFRGRAIGIGGDQHDGLIALASLAGAIVFVKDLEGGAECGRDIGCGVLVFHGAQGHLYFVNIFWRCLHQTILEALHDFLGVFPVTIDVHVIVRPQGVQDDLRRGYRQSSISVRRIGRAIDQYC